MILAVALTHTVMLDGKSSARAPVPLEEWNNSMKSSVQALTVSRETSPAP